MEEINVNLNSDSGNSSGTIKINLDSTNNVKKSVNFGPGAEMLMNPNKNKISSPKADIGLSDLNELNKILSKYKNINYIISNLHPMVLATRSKFAIANYYSTTL